MPSAVEQRSRLFTGALGAGAHLIARLLLQLVAYCLKDRHAVALGCRNSDRGVEN